MSDEMVTRTREQVSGNAKLILTFTLLLAACGGSGGPGGGQGGRTGAGGRQAPPVCSHNPCHTGAPLNYMCDTCVQKICGSATSSCCNLDAGAGVDASWNDACAGMVISYCNQRCDCADAGTPSPGQGFEQYACDCTVTECSSNPGCCATPTTGWTTTCVSDIKGYGYTTGACNPKP